MENTTYELGPLLAEIRDGFRGMRAIRASQAAARREDRRAARGARHSLQRDLASRLLRAQEEPQAVRTQEMPDFPPDLVRIVVALRRPGSVAQCLLWHAKSDVARA